MKILTGAGCGGMETSRDFLPSPLQVIPGPLQQTCLYFAEKRDKCIINYLNQKQVLHIATEKI